jgi:hypothetical protein
MKKLILLFFVFSAYSYFVFAAGTIQLEGSIVSISTEKIELNDGNHIYLLLKNKLENNAHLNLANLKTGQNLNLILPFDAIESTQAISKKE